MGYPIVSLQQAAIPANHEIRIQYVYLAQTMHRDMCAKISGETLVVAQLCWAKDSR